MELVPVRASGVEGVDWQLGPGPNDITVHTPGQLIEFDLLVHGWGPEGLRVYTARLDCTSFYVNGERVLYPLLVRCQDAEPGDFCQGTDMTRPDYVFAGLSSVSDCVLDRMCADGSPGKIECSGASFQGPQPDDGTVRYAGTYAVAYTDGPATLALNRHTDETSVILGADHAVLPSVVSAHILPGCRTDADCDDGLACTGDSCVQGRCAVEYLCSDVLFVDGSATQGSQDGSSWCDAIVHLQDALLTAEASAGVVTEIRVAQGTYRPDLGAAQFVGDRQAEFEIPSGTSILGGFAGCGAPDADARDPDLYETILSGDLLGNDGPDFTGYADNSLHIVSIQKADTTTRLDGLTVAGGDSLDDGGGLIVRAASPAIHNCTFNRCRAGRDGGAVRVEFGSPTISDCRFVDNRADPDSPEYPGAGGAVSCLETGDACTIVHSTFIENTAGSGGSVAVSDGQLTLHGCTFERNDAGWGGGVWGYRDSLLYIDECRFQGNTATVGGALEIRSDSHAVIRRSVLAHNWARDHGGCLASYMNCSLTLENCTLARNYAPTGRAVYLGPRGSANQLDITNSILWDYGDEIVLHGGYRTTVTYNDIYGGWPGEGNIHADPFFVSGPDGCFYLSQIAAGQTADSPCVDAGSALAKDLGFDTTTTRTDEVTDTGVVDMGYHHTVTGATEPTVNCYGCYFDAECQDGVFCNGAESCELGVCVTSVDPCAASALLCDEESDRCVECLSNADCADATECTEDVCDFGDCFNFLIPAQIPLAATDPPDLAIDARQPFDLDGGNATGWQVLEWTFSEPVASLDVGAFVVTEIGGDGIPPEVVSAESADQLTYTITLSEPIEVLAWTDILYEPGCQHSRIGYLPGDVNGSGSVDDMWDVRAVIAAINQLTPRPMHSADVDRNGAIAPPDIIRLIDLLNGAGAYPSFHGTELPLLLSQSE